jgi:hypothetical protein
MMYSAVGLREDTFADAKPCGAIGPDNQWAMIDPRVEPTGFSSDAEREVVVPVHQTARDLQGNDVG